MQEVLLTRYVPRYQVPVIRVGANYCYCLYSVYCCVHTRYVTRVLVLLLSTSSLQVTIKTNLLAELKSIPGTGRWLHELPIYQVPGCTSHAHYEYEYCCTKYFCTSTSTYDVSRNDVYKIPTRCWYDRTKPPSVSPTHHQSVVTSTCPPTESSMGFLYVSTPKAL